MARRDREHIANRRFANRRYKKRGGSALLCLLLFGLLLCLCGCGDSISDGEVSVAEAPELEGIPLNTTQESAMISEGDGKPHKVEITFTEIVKDPEEIREAIDRYNLSAAGYTIPELAEENCSYRIAYYQVKYPEDFPRADYGLLEVAPSFRIVNAYGEDSYLSENVNYSGLAETWELGYHPQGFDFYPGDVYDGILLYMMVDGITNYRIKEIYPTDDKGGTAEHYYMGK